MVNFMELIKSFLVAPYFLGVILGGVFLGIYMLIDKIIKNPMKDIDCYKKFVESYKEEADLESQAKLELVMKGNSSH